MNRLLTIKELAEYLGVHPTTIKNYRNKGMPCYKKERSVRYDLEEVKGWLKSGI